jgi:hypothetical protein
MEFALNALIELLGTQMEFANRSLINAIPGTMLMDFASAVIMVIILLMELVKELSLRVPPTLAAEFGIKEFALNAQ